MPPWKRLIAVLGGVVLLASLFLFDWYGVGEGKLAPLRIDETIVAQVDSTAPVVPVPPPQVPGSPGAPQLPGAPPPELPPDADLAGRPDDAGAWSGQGPLGTLGNIVLLIAALWAIGAAAPLAAPRLPRLFAIITAVLGAAALVVVILRMAFPVEEVDGYSFEASLEFGVFAAAGAAALITLGGLLDVREHGQATGA
jgi:hypothetical protein